MAAPRRRIVEQSKATAHTATTGTVHRFKPNDRECALLVLALIRAKELESEKSFSRCRIAEISLKRLWCRNRISPQLVEAVGDWLSSAGFALFFAGSSYGLIRTDVVERWTLVTSKRLATDLESVAEGTYDFTSLDHLLMKAEGLDGDDG